VISGHFVVFSVVEDIVSIDGPPSSDPLMDALILNAFPGQLVLEIVLRRLLEVGLLTVNLVFDVMVPMVSVPVMVDVMVVMVIIMSNLFMSCTKGTSTNPSNLLGGSSRPHKHVEHHYYLII
jgi:hypothetical protein